MRKYVYIGLGGFLGALLRYQIEQMIIATAYHYFPIVTLGINLSGAFLLAVMMSISIGEDQQHLHELRLGVTSGFLGAYTTFATMCRESISLMQFENYLTGMAYLVLSTVIGFCLARLGLFLVQKRTDRRISRQFALSSTMVEQANLAVNNEGK